MHYHDPTIESEIRDQRQFDEAIARHGRALLAAVAAVAVLGAALVSLVAAHGGAQRVAGSAGAIAARPSGASGVALPPKLIALKIVPGGKLGPDGKMHDAMTQSEFSVRAGQRLDLRIDNTDEGEHSITSPEIGVNILIKPGVHVYHMLVREKGRFSWFCVIPCDTEAHGWAMEHAGYMGGFITVT